MCKYTNWGLLPTDVSLKSGGISQCLVAYNGGAQRHVQVTATAERRIHMVFEHVNGSGTRVGNPAVVHAKPKKNEKDTAKFEDVATGHAIRVAVSARGASLKIEAIVATE